LIVLGLTIPDRATAIIGFIIVGLWLLDVSIVLPIRSARAARRRRGQYPAGETLPGRCLRATMTG
jgi:hypothetical protein